MKSIQIEDLVQHAALKNRNSYYRRLSTVLAYNADPLAQKDCFYIETGANAIWAEFIIHETL